MPHKRAKRSVRLEETKKRGTNLPPSNSADYDAPRSAMRIINSWSTQQSFRANGGRTSEDTGERRKRSDPAQPSTGKGKGKGKDKAPRAAAPAPVPKIMPHESLADFNRRVEGAMRGDVSRAIKSANSKKKAIENKATAGKEERKRATVGPSMDEGEQQKGKRKHDAMDAAIEFKPPPGPRRLGDVAQAPPSLPTLRVARDEGSSVWTAKGKGKSGLSAGQERLMEVERERVIRKYREIKALKEKEREGAREVEEGKKAEKRVRAEKETKREYRSDSE